MKRLAAAAAALTVAACGTTPSTDVIVEAGAPSSTTSTSHRPQAADPTFVDWDGVARIHAHQQAGARAARSRPRPAAANASAPRAGTGDTRVVSSTAYCLTGTMANGQRAHYGAVAMNGVPLASVWRVHGGGTYVVADRIGHSSGFDIAMPGDCAAAIRYGRRTITIERVR